MPNYRLRVWQDSVLSDCITYLVDAGSRGEAVALLADEQEAANRMQDAPRSHPRIRRVVHKDVGVEQLSADMRALDPDDLSDVLHVTEEIGDDGALLWTDEQKRYLLSDAERDTVLAALRLWQRFVAEPCAAPDLSDWEARTDLLDLDATPEGVERTRAIVALAAEHGAPLGERQVDMLCQRLNAG